MLTTWPPAAAESVFLASIWTYIEPTVAIISACLPFFSKFFTDKARKLGSKTRSRRHYGDGYSDHPGSGSRTITKRTITTVKEEDVAAVHMQGGGGNQHELVSYSVRVGARPDGRLRLPSESSQSLV
jgi:hypothetical protein